MKALVTLPQKYQRPKIISLYLIALSGFFIHHCVHDKLCEKSSSIVLKTATWHCHLILPSVKTAPSSPSLCHPRCDRSWSPIPAGQTLPTWPFVQKLLQALSLLLPTSEHQNLYTAKSHVAYFSSKVRHGSRGDLDPRWQKLLWLCYESGWPWQAPYKRIGLKYRRKQAGGPGEMVCCPFVFSNLLNCGRYPQGSKGRTMAGNVLYQVPKAGGNTLSISASQTRFC